MANNCFDTRLLSEYGTSQPQRTLDALLAKAAKVDERKVEDMILFAKKYGAYLNYYDLTNAISGDWQGLLSNDVAITIASIADWNTKDYAPFIKYLVDKIINAANDADARNNFKILFDFVFSVASALDGAYRQLTDKVDYYTFLSVSVSSKLAAPLSILFQYYNTFKDKSPNPLITATSKLKDPLTPVGKVVFAQNFDITALSPIFTANPPITAYKLTLNGGVHDNINHILTHNLFTGALQAFIDAVVNIVNRTPVYLAQTLSKYPSHAPHYALYLTFLKLFNFAQEHLNGYTQKHLDFYYKNVLQLSNNAAEADYVHLVFELQKNINQHLLPKGTSFKAGKDANNNDLFYSLTDDLVVQTAQVQGLKSLYLNKDMATTTLFASPVPNSEDGQGGKLTSPDSSWFPFGNPKNIKQSEIGFTIASKVLYLNEGARGITLKFTSDDLKGIKPEDLAEMFTIKLTGKKDWYTVTSYTPNITTDNLSFTLAFSLAGDAPAIVPYSSKIHGGNFTVQLPMVQVMLNQYKSYQKIKLPKITKANISVTVDKLKNLSLQNNDGKINAAKPFKPFGDFPEDSASFIIGSKEIFQKKLTALSVNFDWQPQMPVDNSIVSGFAEIVNQAKQSNVFYKKDKEFAQLQDNVALLSSPPNPSMKISALVKGDWTDMPGQSSVKLFAAKTDISSGLAPVAQSPTDFDPNSDYAVTSVDGFIRFGLIGKVYNLDTFLKRFTPPSITTVPANSAASAATGFKVDKVDIPVPDPPVIRSIWVTYSATDDIVLDSTLQSFNSRSNFFYHIEPFGFREMHKAITSDDINLLPVFNLDDKTTNDDGGELWIGLGNAKADETFSILFQVSDGSANPLKNMTEVAWYYLNGDNWVLFKDQAVADQTNNLTRSGLVILTVPPDATTTHTRVDAGLIWVKAVVQKDTDAVCNIIAIDTNAAKAQFVQNIDKKIEFTKALTPNIISKPAISDSALKKTQQPYPSFDGRIKETDSQFYLRVSERLRHKHRAITLWDYERLTLQYFPQVFKAKCLNHTGFVIDDSNVQKYVETLAGHVMVITIPDLTNLSTSNILRPYTSIGLLTEIEKYLQTLTSPFVKVKVCNPQFEEVQFEFNVKFRDGFDPTFFKDHLNDEIEQFLTPWAYGNPQAIAFGNTIEKSVVLNFIEERYYVDFVTCFKMSQIITLDTGVKTIPNIDVAIPSTARSILVSYSNAEHTVRHLISSISSPVNCNC